MQRKFTYMINNYAELRIKTQGTYSTKLQKTINTRYISNKLLHKESKARRQGIELTDEGTKLDAAMVRTLFALCKLMLKKL